MNKQAERTVNHRPGIRYRFNKTARLASAVLALNGVSEFIDSGLAAPPPPTVNHNTHVAPKRLLSPSELPGKAEVSENTKETLAAATVKIVRRVKRSEGQGWQELCTGTKIEIDGKSYILTAAHCFNEITKSKYGQLDIKGKAPALNFVGATNLEYGIVDPSADPGIRDANPIGAVKGLSISNDSIDIALLDIEESPITKGGPETGRAYSEIPAIKISRSTNDLDQLLVPGDKVAQYGVPAVNGNVGILTEATYLGTVAATSESGVPYILYLTGINPSQATEDGCEFGASGSTFVPEPKSGQLPAANKFLLGVLSQRNNLDFAYDKSQIKLIQQFEIHKHETNKQIREHTLWWRRYWKSKCT